MSNAELARRAHLSYRLIYNITKGEANPRGETLNAIAGALEVAVADLTRSKATDRVAEGGTQYPMPGEIGRAQLSPPESEGTLAEALRIIGRQFEMPEAEVRRIFLTCMLAELEKSKRGGPNGKAAKEG